MIKTDQIVSLIRSHMNSDDAQFRKIALQISASEARAGHTTAAASIHEAATCHGQINTFKLKAINAWQTFCLWPRNGICLRIW